MHPAASIFNPWTASADEAVRATEVHDPASGVPDPLARRAAALRIMAMRERCFGVGGGCTVLEAMRECADAQLTVPAWLAEEFKRRHSLVTDAHLSSWDDAFGRPWPPKTRLIEVRRRREQSQLVYSAVFARVLAGAAVDEGLFAAIANELDMGISGATARDRYYQALRDGMPNAVDVRNSANGAERLERLSLTGSPS